MYVIIIILIVVLLIAAIFINAIQQHRQKQEAERRTELAKQRTIVDETENVIAACVNIPVSSRIMGILHNRIPLNLNSELQVANRRRRQRFLIKAVHCQSFLYLITTK